MKAGAAFALLILPSFAWAQTIQGRVTDRTSGAPIAGVVVSAHDSLGATIARTVTDTGSGYRISIPRGVVRLQFRRIGFSPAQAGLRDTTGGRLDLTMSRLPTHLPPVKAVAMAQCDSKANTLEVLALWDQVRSGLLTSMVARESRAGYTSVLLYQSSLDGDEELPRAVERVELPPGASGAFISGAEPSTLARDGYVVREGLLNSSYLGPDDRVLFDESFLTSHCFSFEPSNGDSTTINIRFEPGKGVRRVDINGVVRLRRNPLDLVAVEYSYVNVDRVSARAKPGGSIRFLQMPNGITMVGEWRIRSPATITGALIEVMQWPDAPPFVARLATVSGVVTDVYTKRPLPKVPVRLDRTPFTATTDSLGRFDMVDVLPGIYQAAAGDLDLEKYAAAGKLAGPIAISFGANNIAFEAEGPAAAVVRGCSEKVDGRVDMPKALGGRHAIFGQLVGHNVVLPANQEFFAEVTPANAVPGSPAFPLKGKADRDGRFRICNLPEGTVQVRVGTKNGLVGGGEITIDDRPYRVLTVAVGVRAP